MKIASTNIAMLDEIASRLIGEKMSFVQTDDPLFGRNDNAIVEGKSGSKLFVKRLRDLPGADDRFSSCVAAETLKQSTLSSCLSLPKMLALDQELRVLVYEYIPGRALPFASSIESYPQTTWIQAGKSLATLHSAGPKLAPSASISSVPRRTMMQLLDALDFETYWNLSGAELDVWNILHSRRETLLKMVTNLDPSMRRPIHGDLRLDQFIIGPEGKVWLCDWDEFSLGDPAQDIGMFCGDIFMAFLQQGLQEFTQPNGTSDGEGGSDVRDNLGKSASNARSAISSLFAAYRKSLRAIDVVDSSFYVRCGWFFVWHMIERVGTKASLRTHATAIDKAILGIALAMAIDPTSSMKSIGIDHA